MISFLARDPIVRAAALVLLAHVTVFALPFDWSASALDAWAAMAPMMIAMAALLVARHRLEYRERRFWSWLAIGVASWMSVLVWYAFKSGPDPVATVEQSLLDLVYLAFYSSFAIAAELRPELGERRPDPATTRYERLGLASFGVALLFYFVLVPNLLDPLRGRRGLVVDGYFMYLTLDAYLIFRYSQLASNAPGPRWRSLYRALLIAICLWSPFDVLELAWTWPGSGFVLPRWAYPISYLGIYATAAAARLRAYPFPPDPAREAPKEPEDTHPRRLVVYLLLFVAMHFALSLSGLLSSQEHLARELVVLALLVVLAWLLHRQYRELDARSAGLERQRDDAREQIEWRVRAEAQRERFVRELEARQREMERFTYAVSHDLRSPLISMRGFLSLIERDAENGDLEQLHKDIERVRSATGAMGRLLDDLLELSRVGRVADSPENVGLNDLVREAADLVSGRIEKRGTRLEIDPELPHVRGDRRRLLQVFQNLIENAVKFSGDRPDPWIRVGATTRADDVVISVSDNGIGIDPSQHERVFGVFQRLDPDIDGTGMGLTLVRKIVELHGGSVRVESEGDGRGSTFRVTLPRASGSGPGSASEPGARGAG